MTTLQGIISSNLSLTQAQLKADRKLVMEIQSKLANLGFYPGGPWIDGDLGDSSSFSWIGLTNFCNAIGGISIPSAGLAIDLGIATKLVETSQVVAVLDGAKNTTAILDLFKKIQKASPIINSSTPSSAFVSRTINKSPFQNLVDNYPANLESKPDGTSIAFSGSTIGLDEYPNRGSKPNIDNTALNFLSSDITNACVCVGGFTDSTSKIKANWAGKNSIAIEQFLSATKFIGVLNTVCQINEKSPNTDIDDCIIESPRKRFNLLVNDMVSMSGNISSSNSIASMFKRFTQRPKLEKWISDITDNAVDFTGGFFDPPFIQSPIVKDMINGVTVASFSTPPPAPNGNNAVSAYDLVRLISMLGWHQHLEPSAQLPFARWKSLESVVRSMGIDTARYVDVALETLGLINVISEPVIISKVGFGQSSMTYAAFVKFVDNSVNPKKIRTFALALRCPKNNGASDDFCDTRLAAAVTEIIRRIVKEELI